MSQMTRVGESIAYNERTRARQRKREKERESNTLGPRLLCSAIRTKTIQTGMCRKECETHTHRKRERERERERRERRDRRERETLSRRRGW